MKRGLWGFIFACCIVMTACASQTSSAPEKDRPRTEILPPPEFGPFSPRVGQSCGGMVAGPAQTCPEPNSYCHRDISDQCGAADAPGECRIKPEMCTMDYSPVCGCDGITYSNECAANSKGVSAATMGECP